MQAAFIVALFTLQLQSASGQSIYYGARGGVNYSYVGGRTNSGGKVGFNLAGFTGYQVSSNFAVQLEAGYSDQGFRAGDFTPEGADGDMVTLGYIKVPVVAKLYLIDGLNFEVGMSFNFLTTSLSAGEPLGGVNTFDLSLPLGLAYQIGRNAEVGVRWDLSLLPINPSYSGAASVVSLNFAWKF